MKKIMLSGFIILFSISLFAQEKSGAVVSEKVKAEFEKFYPKTEEVSWERHSQTTIASFNRDGKRVVVVFKGDILFSEMTETDVSELPKAVLQHLAKYYKDYAFVRVGEIHFSANPDKDNVAYGADITNGKITKRVVCYPNGNEFMVTNLSKKEEK